MFIQYYQCKRYFSLDLRIQLEKDGRKRGKQEIEKENKEKWEGGEKEKKSWMYSLWFLD